MTLVKLTPGIRRQASFAPVVLLAGFLVGAIYEAIQDWSLAPGPVLRSGSVGFFIALACVAADLSVLRRLDRLPFAIVLITRTVVFALAGAAVLILSRLIFAGGLSTLSAQPRQVFMTVLVTLAVGFFASLFVSLRLTLGRCAFFSLLTGRYRRPVEERRMFMFVDLAESTALAEKIGPKKYHQLIHAFWCDISDAIEAARGEIYKYVGDEAIVTWPLAETGSSDSWTECFFAMRDRVEQNRGEYLRRFGTCPRFRASLHCGMVVGGEVGDCKRELAFLGDTVNTAARILEAGKTHDRSFLVSGEALRRTSGMERYHIERMKEAILRGKEAPVPLYAVERKGGENRG